MHVMIAAFLSSRIRVPLAVDLYDDFESYRFTQLPGIKAGLKRGILSASAISTVSPNLAEKVKNEYRAPGIVRTITNAVCPEIFHRTDKALARRTLCLPESGLLIGTAGALSANRGIQALFQAFEKLSRMRRNLYLILAGRTQRDLHIPIHDNIRYLGELSHSEIGHLFNALDVGIVCNRKNQFAEYCFPQKFYEMIACRLPVVAADVGVMQTLLVGHENCLYNPEEANSLTDAVEKQLNKPTAADLMVPTWKDQAEDFQQLLNEALKRSHRQDRRLGGSGNSFVSIS
jgi:glycosyltransferase involved in cell wall biosynthesis